MRKVLYFMLAADTILGTGSDAFFGNRLLDRDMKCDHYLIVRASLNNDRVVGTG
ncbi:MAG: hypothetical protein ACOH13_13550 [Flavobacteriales bacterium]